MPVNIMAATSITRVQMYSGKPGTTDTTLYTVPASSTAKVTQLVICNTTATAATLDFSIIPPAGTTDGTHKLLSAYSVAANDVVIVDLAQYLDAAGFLSAKQGTSGSLVLTVSGEVYA